MKNKTYTSPMSVRITTIPTSMLCSSLGTTDENVYAILVDNRAIKLHDDILTVTSDYEGRMDQDNFYRHQKQTGFISKYGYIHVFKAA